MGLAASQVRLLSLTSRQHSVENQAEYLQSCKIRLSNESDRVYQTYVNALDETTLKTKQTNNETAYSSWIDGSIYNLMRYQTSDSTTGNVFYVQDIATGKLYVPEEMGQNYDSVKDKEDPAKEFAKLYGINYGVVDNNADDYLVLENAINEAIANGWDTTVGESKYEEYVAAVADGTDSTFLSDNGLTMDDIKNYLSYIDLLNQYAALEHDYEDVGDDTVKAAYYEQIFNAITAAGGWIGVGETQGQNATWVSNMIKNAQVILTTWDADDETLSKTSSSLNTNLKEVTNEAAVDKASQEYEAEMDLINSKDTMYDTKLSTLDTERSSISTEIDSLESIIKDNVEANFKVMG